MAPVTAPVNNSSYNIVTLRKILTSVSDVQSTWLAYER